MKDISWRTIVLWYWHHATNLAMATMFVVYMSSIRVLMEVSSRVEQKHSLTFCVFGQTKNKCFSSSTFPSHNPDKTSLCMAHPSMHLARPQATCCHTKTGLEFFAAEHNWCHTSNFHSYMTYPWKTNILFAR
jgi:hypothetical protein